MYSFGIAFGVKPSGLKRSPVHTRKRMDGKPSDRICGPGCRVAWFRVARRTFSLAGIPQRD